MTKRSLCLGQAAPTTPSEDFK
uniref:Uncharacterized protein n=1 Tax=Timema tahoe TaxID=61484 RepID=A0A7R9NV21_9NEOP|nr:unnamed protein product [Timema tahoe]